jgi:hypothetical protein
LVFYSGGGSVVCIAALSVFKHFNVFNNAELLLLIRYSYRMLWAATAWLSFRAS